MESIDTHQADGVHRVVRASTEAVWRVLADGWSYPLWVVGASRMREVDEAWPAVGARLHHSVGAWPLLIDDTTRVIAAEPRHRLQLEARSWPVGAAGVTITLLPHPEGTEVVIAEDAVRGPALVVPRPLRRLPVRWRNVETLRRLALLAERRENHDAGPR